MISCEDSEKPDPDWNKRLLKSNLGTIYHTKQYGSVIEFIDREPHFVTFSNQKGEIVAQILLSTYSRFEKKGKLKSLLQKNPLSKKQICNWTFGPIIFELDYSSKVSQKFFEFLISKGWKVSGSEHPLSPKNILEIQKPFKFQQWGTFLIDLSKSKDSLWQKMDKHSARKNIERSEKRGVYVKEITRPDLELYQKIREETNPVPLTVLHGRWDRLKEIGWTGFLAFQDEIPIGGLQISFFNGYINEWGIARTKRDTESKLYAQDLLKWKIIEWGQSKKLYYFDLTGANPNSKNEKEAGIFRYKKKWGGDLVKYNIMIN